MANFYMDTDAGSDANNGTTWALAKLTLEGLLAVMSAGDRGWIQGAAADNSVSNRTFTSPGTVGNPCILTGVVDGTSNEPPVLSDLAVTLPVVSTTGATIDINFAGEIEYRNVRMIIGDRPTFAGNVGLTFVNSKFTYRDLAVLVTNNVIKFINTDMELTGVGAKWFVQGSSLVSMSGGEVIFTAASQFVHNASNSDIELTGVDFSGLTLAIIDGSGTSKPRLKMRNCIMPATFTVFSTPPTESRASAELIACSSTTSQAATSSIQDYLYEDAYGTINAEFTAVRTGGADDGASGAFSYAMTPKANATLESSGAALKSPWISLWIIAGSQTLTIFLANDSASTDYNEDEVWVEFYTPDSADTAQHEQNFVFGDARLFASSTAITDDTGSTWGTGGNNHQKLSVAVTPGFEGPAYARLHLAKRQATPDTLYLDPLIEIS